MITIIIPCYNAERFLHQCLDCVLGQNYIDLEVICVNDGSADRTREILGEYEARDKRVKVINKDNEGVSVARNIALASAKGEFVYFCDADDIVEPTALEHLFSMMESSGADLVKADFKPIDADDHQLFVNKRMAIRKRYDGKLLNGAAFYSKILMGEFFLWTCLFKKSVIDEHDIRFIPGCRYMEDAAFMVEYLSHCKWATYMHDVVYRYRIYGATAGQSRKDYTQDMNLIEASIHKMPDSRIKWLFLSEINKVIKKRTKGESGWQIFADKILLNLKYQLCKNK